MSTGLEFFASLAECNRDFTSREWVFAEIDRWLATPGAPRLFVVTGEPGIGKNAITAQLTGIHPALPLIIPALQFGTTV